ncbi:MAG: hypothetical protein IJO06_03215 [Thermoguttaceae bacterium]|nr:hypothetical protein [Thermoguttaceae bacterium]
MQSAYFIGGTPEAGEEGKDGKTGKLGGTGRIGKRRRDVWETVVSTF